MAENRPPIRLVAADGTRLGVYADYTKNVKETMPAASAEYADVSVFYVGKQSGDFTPGHLYTCIKEGSVYKWADVTPTGGSATVLEYPFCTNEDSGTIISFTKEELGVEDSYPEYDIIDTNGYNISADTRVARRWDKTRGVYEVAYLGGWPTGCWALKSIATVSMNGGYTIDAYTKAEVDAMIHKVIVNETSTALVVPELNENTYIICSNPLTSLTVNTVEKSAKESIIIFTAGNNFTASFPADLEWIAEPTFESGKKYVLICNYNIAAASQVSVL